MKSESVLLGMNNTSAIRVLIIIKFDNTWGSAAFGPVLPSALLAEKVWGLQPYVLYNNCIAGRVS